jgi:hypothetical protein
MKYILYKDGCGFAVYDPNDGSVSHTLNYAEATEACLCDWSDVLAFDFGDYKQIMRSSDVNTLATAALRYHENSIPSANHMEEWHALKAALAALPNGDLSHSPPKTEKGKI